MAAPLAGGVAGHLVAQTASHNDIRDNGDGDE